MLSRLKASKAGFFVVRSMVCVGRMLDGVWLVAVGPGLYELGGEEGVADVERVCDTYLYVANKMDHKSDGRDRL